MARARATRAGRCMRGLGSRRWRLGSVAALWRYLWPPQQPPSARKHLANPEPHLWAATSAHTHRASRSTRRAVRRAETGHRTDHTQPAPRRPVSRRAGRRVTASGRSDWSAGWLAALWGRRFGHRACGDQVGVSPCRRCRLL